MEIPKIGSTVQLVVTPITGEIKKIQSDDDGQIQGLVSWVDSDTNETCERWFDVNKLIEVK